MRDPRARLGQGPPRAQGAGGLAGRVSCHSMWAGIVSFYVGVYTGIGTAPRYRAYPLARAHARRTVRRRIRRRRLVGRRTLGRRRLGLVRMHLGPEPLEAALPRRRLQRRRLRCRACRTAHFGRRRRARFVRDVVCVVLQRLETRIQVALEVRTAAVGATAPDVVEHVAQGEHIAGLECVVGIFQSSFVQVGELQRRDCVSRATYLGIRCLASRRMHGAASRPAGSPCGPDSPAGSSGPCRRKTGRGATTNFTARDRAGAPGRRLRDAG